MTVATMTKTKKNTGKKDDMPPLPPTAKVVEIAGRDCVIVPLDEYDDWLQDALLAVVAEDRLKNQPGETISLEEFETRLNTKKKRR